jgi:hypothetical protein
MDYNEYTYCYGRGGWYFFTLRGPPGIVRARRGTNGIFYRSGLGIVRSAAPSERSSWTLDRAWDKAKDAKSRAKSG